MRLIFNYKTLAVGVLKQLWLFIINSYAGLASMHYLACMSFKILKYLNFSSILNRLAMSIFLLP